MVYILQIYNKCTTFPNQIVITIISGAKFFASQQSPGWLLSMFGFIRKCRKGEFFWKGGKGGNLGKDGKSWNLPASMVRRCRVVTCDDRGGEWVILCYTTE